jgi:DNA-binding PadR family transcriptional regulator
MSVGHVLLGVLAEGPAHGYDLKHAHDERYPGAKQLAFGQVYAALAKLEKDGFVEVIETARGSGPDRTTYALTPAGKTALGIWLSEVEPAGPYAADELVRKTVTALRLGRDAADYLARQREAHLTEMRRLVALQESTDEVEARVVIDHAVEHLDADLRWLSTAAVRVQTAGRRTARPNESASDLDDDPHKSSNRKVVR